MLCALTMGRGEEAYLYSFCQVSGSIHCAILPSTSCRSGPFGGVTLTTGDSCRARQTIDIEKELSSSDLVPLPHHAVQCTASSLFP